MEYAVLPRHETHGTIERSIRKTRIGFKGRTWQQVRSKSVEVESIEVLMMSDIYIVELILDNIFVFTIFVFTAPVVIAYYIVKRTNVELDLIETSDPIEFKRLLKISQILHHTKCYKSETPISIFLFLDGLYYIDCDELFIYSHGETYDEVMKEFARDFDCLWTKYQNIPDKDLYHSSVDVKRRFEKFKLIKGDNNICTNSTRLF